MQSFPQILFFYASTGGNTHLVCHAVHNVLLEQGLEAKFMRVEQYDKAAIDGTDVLILASPTYGHGQLEPRFEKLFRKLQDWDLTGKHVAVIGLGDDKYDDDYNVESAVILTEFAEAKGGTMLGDALKINKNPVPQIEGKVEPWAEALVHSIQALNIKTS